VDAQAPAVPRKMTGSRWHSGDISMASLASGHHTAGVERPSRRLGPPQILLCWPCWKAKLRGEFRGREGTAQCLVVGWQRHTSIHGACRRPLTCWLVSASAAPFILEDPQLRTVASLGDRQLSGQRKLCTDPHPQSGTASPVLEEG
jgi:hypothetical protein